MFPHNLAAEEALAAVGAVLRSIQIIPQIWKSYKTKSTHGLSSAFMLAWACTQLALGPYTVVQQLAIPLQIQPQAFCFFSAVSWAQCLYYGKEYSRTKTALCFVALLTVLAGAQAGSVFGLRAGRAAGTETPVMVFGYLTWLRTFLSAPPQFYKIYQLGEVVGFSFLFMAIDMVGALFSILSLLFRQKLDIPAVVTFALVIVQNGLVILLALILNPIARKRRLAEIGGSDEFDSQYPSSEYLSRRRSTHATQYSTASSMTCVNASNNQSARQSKVDLEKGGLAMSRTTTVASKSDVRATAVMKEGEVGEGCGNTDSNAAQALSAQLPVRSQSRIEFREPFNLPSRSESTSASTAASAFASASATPLGGRSRNATAVDLTALAQIDEKEGLK